MSAARVLLLEDDPLSSMLAAAVLGDAGYHVDTVEVGGAPYDAVLRGVAQPVQGQEVLDAVAAALVGGDVVDRAVLGHLVELGRDVVEDHLVADLVEQFAADTPDRLAGARRSLAAGDLATVARLAHAVKGASAQLGGLRLSESCVALQRAAESGDASATGAAAARVEQGYDELLAALGRYLASE